MGQSITSAGLSQQELSLSDLFHLETFLGALRQSTARHHQTSMESLRLANWWGSTGQGLQAGFISGHFHPSFNSTSAAN